MASILLKHIYKAYPHSKKDKKKEKKQKISPFAVRDFNLEIQDGEFIVLVGPSGCGKSTTLRMIAGLEDISAGELYINDVFANNLESSKRDIAMVFQSYALYPHMTSYQNMSYGLKLRKDYFPVYKIEKQKEFEQEKKQIEKEFDTKKKEGLQEFKNSRHDPFNSTLRNVARTSIFVSGAIRALFFLVSLLLAINYGHNPVIICSLLMLAALVGFGLLARNDLNKGKQRVWLAPVLAIFVSSITAALYLLRNPEKELDDDEVIDYNNDVEDFVYTNSLEKQNALAKLYDKYQTPVMTYDHEKVNELNKELKKTNDPVEKETIQKEIEEVRSNLNTVLHKKRHYTRQEIDKKVQRAAKVLDITFLLDRKPSEMSGGQRQRVALGRALVRDPKVFLLDEPLSNLDAKLRATMRNEIVKLHEKIKTTFVYVTHDQVEAMTMGDRIVVMKDGLIQQVDTPSNIYDNPHNIFVAGFIGTPQMNFFNAKMQVVGDEVQFTLSEEAKLSYKLSNLRTIKSEYTTGGEKEVTFGIRGEHISLAEKGIPAEVTFVEILGNTTNVLCKIKGTELEFTITLQERARLISGDEIFIGINEKNVHLFDKETGDSIYE